MSRENALRFMMAKDNDEAVKNEINNIVARYEGKNLSEEEWDSVWEEMIPFAVKHGFDFTKEDLKQIRQPADGKLSDEELDGVTGGRGEITVSIRSRYRKIITFKATCDYMPDDQTFQKNYDTYLPDCPYYVWFGNGNNITSCSKCANCHLTIL